MRKTFALSFSVLVLLMSNLAFAVVIMPESVISGGGTEISGGSKTIRCTVSQGAIGLISSPSYDMEIGFWHGFRAVVTDVQPLAEFIWEMDQNHPNPFNPMTTVKYSLPRQSHVRLRIFNLRGQVIRSLVDGLQNAGVHTAVWDGRDDHGLGTSSGTYFARLESAEGTLTRKMLLIK